jgi:hypothetical protein
MQQLVVWVITLHSLSTMMMTGIIWFIQLVHYPLFSLIRTAQFGEYIFRNRFRTGAVVTPIMTVEVLSAIGLFFLPHGIVGLPIRVVGAAIVGVVWCSTLFVQWPIHRRLQEGFSEPLLERLLKTNWIRTVGWSCRALIAIDIVYQVGFF